MLNFKLISIFRKEVILLVAGLLLIILNISGLGEKAAQSYTINTRAQSTPTPTPDPRKEFKSLETYISYNLPSGWQKKDYVDQEFGNTAYITLTSPDYESPETFIINSGVRISITRTYDTQSEETLSRKLGDKYEIYNYNVMPLKIDGKNAMTMHEDYEGHNRFIYIANGNHLWQISIASKSLEDEAKYEEFIKHFLSSVKFKN